MLRLTTLALAAAAAVEGFSLAPKPASQLLQYHPDAEVRPGVDPDCYSMQQAREHGSVEVKCAGAKGLGAFATEPIPIHTDLGDYYGEIFTEAEVAARYTSTGLPAAAPTAEDEAWAASRKERGQGITGDYLMRAGDKYVCAEDTDVSGWTRFMNHDEPGNCRLKILPKGIGGKPRCWLVAARDIEEGEEITFSYGDEYQF